MWPYHAYTCNTQKRGVSFLRLPVYVCINQVNVRMSASISKIKGHNMPTSHETDMLKRFHVKPAMTAYLKMVCLADTC